MSVNRWKGARHRDLRRENVAIQMERKRAYVAPRVVDFGTIETMTGDCLGLCVDGEHHGWFGIYP